MISRRCHFQRTAGTDAGGVSAPGPDGPARRSNALAAKSVRPSRRAGGGPWPACKVATERHKVGPAPRLHRCAPTGARSGGASPRRPAPIARAAPARRGTRPAMTPAVTGGFRLSPSGAPGPSARQAESPEPHPTALARTPLPSEGAPPEILFFLTSTPILPSRHKPARCAVLGKTRLAQHLAARAESSGRHGGFRLSIKQSLCHASLFARVMSCLTLVTVSRRFRATGALRSHR